MLMIKIGVQYMVLKNMVDDHGYKWVDLWKGSRTVADTCSLGWDYNTTCDYETEENDV